MKICNNCGEQQDDVQYRPDRKEMLCDVCHATTWPNNRNFDSLGPNGEFLDFKTFRPKTSQQFEKELETKTKGAVRFFDSFMETIISNILRGR